MSNWVGKEVSGSKFAMWRSAVAILHADGKIHESENAWLRDKIEKLGFSDSQIETLEDDLRNGVSFDTVLKQVTERRDRAFLLHLVRTVGHLDGEYCSSEQAKYNELHEKVLGKLDLTELEADIVESSYDHRQEMSGDKKHSLLWRGLDFLHKIF